ncbi:hypothetical protein BDV98DRAFT_659819 [Pterulicium gracile]|uniref:Uncharacterized protein n=1 Tax=Pterulicium gracile TaxID=1884261 RepID=A0A5C3Q2D5_9AGAR|nr:hypothetical protein BDV98DRAFT_659819 [Pterula gracilis]
MFLLLLPPPPTVVRTTSRAIPLPALFPMASTDPLLPMVTMLPSRPSTMAQARILHIHRPPPRPTPRMDCSSQDRPLAGVRRPAPPIHPSTVRPSSSATFPPTAQPHPLPPPITTLQLLPALPILFHSFLLPPVERSRLLRSTTGTLRTAGFSFRMLPKTSWEISLLQLPLSRQFWLVGSTEEGIYWRRGVHLNSSLYDCIALNWTWMSLAPGPRLGILLCKRLRLRLVDSTDSPMLYHSTTYPFSSLIPH